MTTHQYIPFFKKKEDRPCFNDALKDIEFIGYTRKEWLPLYKHYRKVYSIRNAINVVASHLIRKYEKTNK